MAAALSSLPPKRIMLVIAGRIFRHGIELVLRTADRDIIAGCETLADVDDYLDANPELPPDLLVIGMSVPERFADDFSRVRALRARLPGARWVVLSRKGDRDFWCEAVESRIDGILQEDSPGEVLQHLVELLLLGYSFLPCEVATSLAGEWSQARPEIASTKEPEPEARGNHHVDRSPDGLPAVPSDSGIRWQSMLSERESDILRGLVVGHSNKLIARDLHISEATVKVHVKALLRKMQVTNRTQAAISAIQHLHSTLRLVPPHRGLALATEAELEGVETTIIPSGRTIQPPARLSLLVASNK